MRDKDVKCGIGYLQWLWSRAKSCMFHINAPYKASKEL